MEYHTLKDVKNLIDQPINLRGWVVNFRSSGKIGFLEFRDGFDFIQCVIEQKNVGEKIWEDFNNLTLESVINIQGKVAKHPKKDEYEIHINNLEVLHLVKEEYPISKKEHGADFLLQNRHLWLRSKSQWAIQKIRTTVIKSIYDYLINDNFTKIDSPIFTPNACEGTTELFKVPYFDKFVYLSQSGQLYLEACIMSLGKVFDFGPTFRAEKSKTRRHLNEFWMMDAEMAFYDNEKSLVLQENLICFVVEQVLKENKKELEILERNTDSLEKIKAPFIRMTHQEAVDKLNKLGSPITYKDDLGAEDETLLTSDTDRPVFVTHWPAEIKAFYMKRDGENRALCADLIATDGFGEIIGGSQREDDYNTLLKRIKEHKLPIDYFEWYLDLRKYGTVEHSGFGIGLERLVAWITGIRHIRETIPFPRTITRITP